MSLQSLVFCSDEKILRVLRRVLSDLEIRVEQCPDAQAAIHKLTRQRFEAVIVDCLDERLASQVLRSARTAPCNKRAIAVAIIDGQQALKSAFELGAHFVLYKPISMERARTSFRAARALMKRERRRNLRVPLSIPVVLATDDGVRHQTTTSDIGEGGVAVQSCLKSRTPQPLRIQFTLPGSDYSWEGLAEVAWETSGRNAGLRFVDSSPEAREQLRKWLNQQAPEMEQDDPPVPCKLTDLSPGGCYLETNTPFPVRARLVLSMSIAGMDVEVTGVVRVMHPENGMGIEFMQNTPTQRNLVEKFIHALRESKGELPELLVEPEGLEAAEADGTAAPATEPIDDPLLELFAKGFDLGPSEFIAELHRQRGETPKKGAAAFSV